MTINRRIFFDQIRLEPFRGLLPAATVQGCGAIIDEWERRGLVDLRHLAYMLATARGECGPNMLPVREGFAKSDEAARAYVAKQGYKYGHPVNGHVYYGRGLVQLTWDYNYKKMSALTGVDLLNNPDRALEPPIAAKILFEGMIHGSFTGKKLTDYLNATSTDWINARRIINGTDKAAQFAAWAKQFHVALIAASSNAVATPAPPDVEPVKPAEPKAPNNTGGTIGGTIAVGGGVVVANETKKKGASTGEIVTVLVCTALIAAAVFLLIRNWRKKS